MKKLVVFNLIGKDNMLLIPSGLPIIFSWNGTGEVFNEMLANESFKNLIYEKCLSIEQYSYAKISYFTLDVKSEKYEEKNIKIQDAFKLEDIRTINNDKIAFEYICKVLMDVFEYSTQKKYLPKTNETDIDVIFNIYKEIKENIGNKLSDYSLRQYIVSELQSKYRLSQDNIKYIMKIYDSTL